MRPLETTAGGEKPRGLLSNLAPEVRRQVLVGLVVFHYVLVLGVGGWYNFSIYSERASTQQQVMGYENELARLPVVAAELNEARAARDQLQDRRDELYGLLPDLATVPVVIGQLEELALAAGGELIEVQYSPPSWSADRGQVRISIVFEGEFGAIQDYMASVNASVPSLRWNGFDIVPADAPGRELTMYADIGLDVLATRPAGAAPWDGEQVQVVRTAAVPSPFATGVSVHAPMPELALHGVVMQNGRSLALLSVDGVSHLVSPGQTVEGLTVVQIAADSVVVRSGERTAEVTLID